MQATLSASYVPIVSRNSYDCWSQMMGEQTVHTFGRIESFHLPLHERIQASSWAHSPNEVILCPDLAGRRVTKANFHVFLVPQKTGTFTNHDRFHLKPARAGSRHRKKVQVDWLLSHIFIMHKASPHRWAFQKATQKKRSVRS